MPIRHREDWLIGFSREPLGQRHQLIRVSRGLGATHYGVVARAFRFQNESPPQNPDERVKPVDGTYCSREAAREPVAAPHVFQFVNDGATQFLTLPAGRIDGQEDGWM